MIEAGRRDYKECLTSGPYNSRVPCFQRLALAAAFLALVAPGAAARELPRTVRDALRAAAVPAAAVAAVVQEVGAAQPALSVNADRAMNPASVMKLVTTFAALELLGPAYRWKTEAYVSGALREGVLARDLVLKGYGDPRLDYESFWMLLRALRGKGLREIRGDLVLDRSFFAPSIASPADFDGDALRPYNVLPDALLVHYKSLRFAFVPEPEKDAVRIYVAPRPPGLELINHLRLSAGSCPEGRAFRDLLQPDFEAGPPPRAAFAGRYPIGLRRERGQRRATRAEPACRGRVARTVERDGRYVDRACTRGRSAAGRAPAAHA